MRTQLFDEEPWFNRFTVFTFAEGDGDGDGGDGGTGDADGDGDGDGDGDSGGDGDKGGSGDGKGGEDNSGLKSALEKERQARKNLEKEMRALRKFKEETESKDKSEADKAKEAEQKSTEKVGKLATKLRQQAVESAIAKVARSEKFRDVDDAISLVKLSDISVEQDEDDPSEIEIDEKSVERAVKELAKKKPHLLIAEGDGTPSGGKFGGGKKGNESSEEALARKYPALRRPRQ